MPTLFQINVTANWGSTGRIAEEIGRLALGQGWDCYMAYGRGMYDSRLRLVRVGSRADMYWHGVQSRLLDRHGLASVGATRRLVRQMDAVKPDVVHLHNIHGYYTTANSDLQDAIEQDIDYGRLFDLYQETGYTDQPTETRPIEEIVSWQAARELLRKEPYLVPANRLRSPTSIEKAAREKGICFPHLTA